MNRRDFLQWAVDGSLWTDPLPFKYDYSAAGARRSVEDSLQRLGISQIDIVFIL